jgi:hypothetical protein
MKPQLGFLHLKYTIRSGNVTAFLRGFVMFDNLALHRKGSNTFGVTSIKVILCRQAIQE